MSAHDISSGRQNLPSGMHPKRWRMTHGPGEARVRSIHGLRSTTRFRRVREAIRWRPSPTRLLVSRPVSLLGVRTADLSRKPARHRDVSAGPRAQALPCGLPRQGLAEHIGRCQPRSRLAHLCRVRSSVDRSSAETLRRRTLRRGVGADCLCPRQYHDRPLSESVPLGAVPSSQRGRKAAHSSGSARQHSHFRADYPRQNPRCDSSRSSANRARRILCAGPRLCRFSTSSSVHDVFGVLRDTSQTWPRLHPPSPSAGRQDDRTSERPDDRAGGPEDVAASPRPPASRRVLRRRERPEVCVPDQQLLSACVDDCKTLQMSMASRVCFSNGSNRTCISKPFTERATTR